MATKRVTASPAIHKFIKPNGLFIALGLEVKFNQEVG